MSIIEEAVRRTAEKHRRTSGESTYSRPKPRRVSSAGPPAEVIANALRFQSITMDATVLEKNRILPQVTDPAALRAYKILRTRLLRRLEAGQSRTFAVTGVAPGEGKTLTAINLAMALAQDVSTWVILVDLDLQRPRVAEYLGMSSMGTNKGLNDYLLGDASIDSIVYNPGIERLSIIPTFEAIPQSSELLSSPRMLDLVHTLEAEIPRRVIIFDMPPVLASDDVLAFAPQVDGLLLVVGEGTTGRDALRSAKEVLAEMNLLGVVLNRSAEPSDSAYGSYARP
jgi:capsular exopolysaccharide synthesis family protein